uniref:Uncharacterized protein n=1 Tax=Schizaphis graminum TaxID=13262 RepID=A0A2S2NTX2_SCHGA
MSQIFKMQYLSAPWTFEPYLKDKLYHGIRNEEEILVKFIKALYLKPILQWNVFDDRRRNAGIRDNDIGKRENGGTNGYGGTNRYGRANVSGYHCGTGAIAVPVGYNEARGLPNSREGTRLIRFRRT